ncbi:SDR family oxidoreductase [Microbulbifer guangxiensis]|uniref:SDR family oxidoreductase n=1 Tax=Microbulbifer guangxiensis TaxID=2904249 RepID=UPI001F02334E|nr:SDR family oxidoreductase [Microbulbifer guangxiensis]
MSTRQQCRTVLLTGASGGLGHAIARLLAEQGDRLLLQGRNADRLEQLRCSLANPGRHRVLAADLLESAGRRELVQMCRGESGLDVLINNAGISRFALLGDLDDRELADILHTNLLVPMALTRDLLPLLQQSPAAAVINIGSTFGHIGHPGFTAYSASKAGLFGFTEALRRECADGGVRVHYLAPRAVDTELNTPAVRALNRALRNKADTPAVVALQCSNLLHKASGQRRFIGWPERFFIKINALFPGLVDSALSKKLPVIRRYAKQGELPGEAL